MEHVNRTVKNRADDWADNLCMRGSWIAIPSNTVNKISGILTTPVHINKLLCGLAEMSMNVRSLTRLANYIEKSKDIQHVQCASICLK